MEFSGELSAKCKKSIINQTKLINFICMWPGVIIIIVFLIYFAITFHPLLWIAVFPNLSFPFLALLPIDKKTFKTLFPTRVYLEGDIIVSENEVFYESRNINDVKKVIDYGEWYVLIFYVGHRSGKFICQKNLLIKGSLDEFEKLFQGKIVRKIK